MALACVAVGWLPLLLFGVIEWSMDGRPGPLLRWPPVHVRFLASVPLFFLYESLVDLYAARSVDMLATGPFGDVSIRHVLPGLVHRAESLRDSRWIEGVLLVLALVAGRTAPYGLDISTLARGSLSEDRFGVRFWYPWVSLPLFRFLLFRGLFRWFIWARFLFQVSRVDLHPEPGHPDQAGGLAFLSEPINGFAAFLAGVSATIAATWAADVRFAGANVSSYVPQIAISTAVFAVVAVSPLCVFSTQLFRARLRAADSFSRLASFATGWFERRFMASPNPGVVQSFEVQSLADLANVYDRAARLRLVPVDLRTLGIVFLAILAPMSALPLVALPFAVLIHKLVALLLGEAH
jgi:hypothetical protein